MSRNRTISERVIITQKRIARFRRKTYAKMIYIAQPFTAKILNKRVIGFTTNNNGFVKMSTSHDQMLAQLAGFKTWHKKHNINCYTI